MPLLEIELNDGEDWFCSTLRAYSDLTSTENDIDLIRALKRLSGKDKILEELTVILYQKSSSRILKTFTLSHLQSLGVELFDHLIQHNRLNGLNDSTLYCVHMDRSYLLMAYGLSFGSEANACLVAFPEPSATCWRSYLVVRLLISVLYYALNQHGQYGDSSASLKKLSAREIEILRWVARGKTNPEIGLILGISGFTIKNHLANIFAKLNVVNRAQAIDRVLAAGILGSRFQKNDDFNDQR